GRCSVPAGVDPFTYLFSESTGRAVVVVPPESADRLLAVCAERGLPAAFIGVVDVGQSLEFTDLFTASLAELREAHESTLPRLFG
ncbi:MAG: phosphoribosylformylglycinamidine synthase II, partial [Actinobacteria bacterium]|nr:phosphoribosylformylglycinamidine synthase II [Actinomycetota bacterium]